MTVKVLFFARARELAGLEAITLEIPASITIRDLQRELTQCLPALADFLPRCQWAVQDTLAAEETVIPEGATVAVLPPVSGG
ncbi:hypothetical protein HRbin36_01235 [bacterium HR36]|nr:hypothetical protein HRbin36_01235 [bacterium HR36]